LSIFVLFAKVINQQKCKALMVEKMLTTSKLQDKKTLLTDDDNILEKLVINARKDNKDGLYLLCDKIAKTVLFRTTRFIGGSDDAEDVSQGLGFYAVTNGDGMCKLFCPHFYFVADGEGDGRFKGAVINS
jgi:hypothetical protein